METGTTCTATSSVVVVGVVKALTDPEEALAVEPLEELPDDADEVVVEAVSAEALAAGPASTFSFTSK